VTYHRAPAPPVDRCPYPRPYRFARAGMLDHMQEALTKYPADEKVQFVVLGVIYSVVAGGDFPETEKRREVGTPLLSAVLDAMKRSPQSGIVQHTG
jgi:hypothetical protein